MHLVVHSRFNLARKTYKATAESAVDDADRSKTFWNRATVLRKKIPGCKKELADYLAKAMDDVKLRRDDPLVAAIQLRASLDAEVFEPCILGAVGTPLDDIHVKYVVERAVTSFLRAFHTDHTTKKLPHF